MLVDFTSICICCFTFFDIATNRILTRQIYELLHADIAKLYTVIESQDIDY